MIYLASRDEGVSTIFLLSVKVSIIPYVISQSLHSSSVHFHGPCPGQTRMRVDESWPVIDVHDWSNVHQVSSKFEPVLRMQMSRLPGVENRDMRNLKSPLCLILPPPYMACIQMSISPCLHNNQFLSK